MRIIIITISIIIFENLQRWLYVLRIRQGKVERDGELSQIQHGAAAMCDVISCVFAGTRERLWSECQREWAQHS